MLNEFLKGELDEIEMSYLKQTASPARVGTETIIICKVQSFFLERVFNKLNKFVIMPDPLKVQTR